MGMREKLYAFIMDWPEVSGFQKALAEGLETAGFERDSGVIIVGLGGARAFGGTGEILETALDLLGAQEIDGYISGLPALSSFPDGGALVETIESRYRKPFARVLPADGPGSPTAAKVASDFEALIKHLVERHGYRSFAYVSGPEYSEDARSRLGVFRRTLAASGIELGEDRVVFADFQAVGGMAAAATLLDERGIIPRAIVCANDMMAAGVVKELARRGIAVPKEIAVTGFDGIVQDGKTYLPFTTIRLGFGDLSGNALRTLDDAVRGLPARDYGGASSEFVLGATCGCSQEDEADGPFPRPSASASASASGEADIEEDFMIDNKIADWCMAIVRERNPAGGAKELAELAKAMGIERFRLTLLEDPGDARGSRLILTAGIEKGERMGLPEGGLAYPARSVVPPYFSFQPGKAMNVDFLISEGTLLGFIHCSARTKGRRSLEAIRSRLSTSLYTIWMFRRLEAAEAKVKAALERVESLSIHDELTGILNRRGFLAVGGQHLGFLRRGGARAVVLYCDLDGLKRINDLYGHAEGDWAIKAAASTLRETLRESDAVARLGGDEFAVIAASEEPGGAERIIARLSSALDALNAASGKPFEVRLSAGWTSAPSGGAYDSLEELMKAADKELYAVKRSKRGKTAE